MKKILLFLVAVSLLWPFSSSAYGQEYQAWIKIEAENSHLKIKAYCLNNTSENANLRHKLTVWKLGKSGRTSTAQSGYVCLQGQEEKCLSQLGLGVSPKDEYEIKLEVYKDRKLVTEDFVVYSRGTWI